MFWHSVISREEKERGGFSYRNKNEAAIVCDYVEKLLNETNVEPEEIGIITPYKYQV